MLIALRNYQNAVLFTISLAMTFFTKLLKVILLNIQNKQHTIKTLLMCILSPFASVPLTTICKQHGNILAIVVTHYREAESFTVETPYSKAEMQHALLFHSHERRGVVTHLIIQFR